MKKDKWFFRISMEQYIGFCRKENSIEEKKMKWSPAPTDESGKHDDDLGIYGRPRETPTLD